LRSGRTNRGRAFTIVELIVVVVILAVLAAAIGPRLAAMGGREVRASAMEVGDLVSVAARRDALTSQRVAIEFEGDKSRLVLMTMDVAPSGGGSPVAEWREDKLIPPVLLGNTKITDASTDGVALDARGWRVEFPQGGRRPALALILSDPKGKEHWRVELPSSAAHAAISPGNALGMSDQAVDLDAGGGGTSPW
jgi:prepilin-type N-terminal cleavage/methylation domain-containing protein